jgi:hypothetical protein
VPNSGRIGVANGVEVTVSVAWRSELHVVETTPGSLRRVPRKALHFGRDDSFGKVKTRALKSDPSKLRASGCGTEKTETVKRTKSSRRREIAEWSEIERG